MNRWMLRAAITLILTGLALSGLRETRADRDAAVQRPAAIESVELQPILANLSEPLFVTNARDQTNRLFIVERTGKIKVLQPGATTPTVFLDVTAKVELGGGEQGLLGLAFHPQYPANGRFFIYYAKTPDGSLQTSEFHVSAANLNVADPTEIPLLNIAHPFNQNHNGGMLAFGPDGYLYLGPGDGGNGNDPPNNAQNINLLLGKILRIDVDHGAPYTSPATNPFFGATPGADEIWMTGMRNPWRFAFDRANPNILWIADVGQSAQEEIDRIDITQNPASGARNGGWRIFEGNDCTGFDPCTPLPQNYVPPLAQYAHLGGRCSIIGGYVYRGTRGTFPAGAYVYADLCTGEIFTLIGGVQTIVARADPGLTSFGEDEAGELYICTALDPNQTVRKLVESNSRNVIADLDGDRKTDISVYRAGTWYYLNSSDGAFRAVFFGNSTDRPVPGDYDGDGKTDVAVWRDSAATFFMLRSSNGTFQAVPFGLAGDLPVQGDYDGDRKTDIALYRPSQSVWYYLTSANGAFNQQAFGTSGDQLVPGDYNGDGRSDFALFRPSTGQWFILPAGAGEQTIFWGANGDRPAPADYDGDEKTDVAVFRPANGGWYIKRSSDGALQAATWGMAGDIPVPGDYDGDNRDDVAVYRNGAWYILRSTNGALMAFSFGLGGDVPVPAAYKPQ